MKILIEHGLPFQLAHGGFQTHIEETKRGLEEAGAEVEWLRWWDGEQKGDIIHAFSPITNAIPHYAKEKQIPVVVHTLLSGACDASRWKLVLKSVKESVFRNAPVLRGSYRSLPAEIFHMCSLNLVNLRAEGRAMEKIYRVPSEKIVFVPFGLQQCFLDAKPATRSQEYMICPATITERKNSILLAKLAKAAEVPILFVGKPYHAASRYWKEFESLIDNQWVRYRPHVASVSEMVNLYRESRAFVILSQIETLCLAAQEAAACGLPVLLPDQAWAHELFGSEASYFDGGNFEKNTAILKLFYQKAATASAPQMKFKSWKQVGEEHITIFKRLIN